MDGSTARGETRVNIGAVVNVASTFAYQPTPDMAVYDAAKTFVLNFIEAPWYESRGTGVKTLAVSPGPTSAEFFDSLGGYEMPKRISQAPEQVVETTLRALDRPNSSPSVAIWIAALYTQKTETKHERKRRQLMYRLFVERKVRETFRQLGEGNWEAQVEQMPPELLHVFAGDHALGGVRRTPEGMRKWFGRLYEIFPDLGFEVKGVLVRGWPWDTRVAVKWADRATPANGVPYVNEGTHVLRLRWGKLVYLHAYLDTQKVAEVCDRLAEGGMAEAAAPPIEE